MRTRKLLLFGFFSFCVTGLQFGFGMAGFPAMSFAEAITLAAVLAWLAL